MKTVAALRTQSRRPDGGTRVTLKWVNSFFGRAMSFSICVKDKFINNLNKLKRDGGKHI